VPDLRFRGYVEHAADVLKAARATSPAAFTAEQLKFLADGFKDAADRMTTLASAVGTSGSFILVLVALLVGFATNTNAQSDKLLTASNTQAQLALGCSGKASTTACDAAKLEQAQEEVRLARNRLEDLGRLNQAQAIAGAFVVAAFLLGLAAMLSNPVPGPDATKRDEASVNAWKKALDRLKVKRRWIEASLAAQLGAIVSIGVVGATVF
jgi:hypothetical protein